MPITMGNLVSFAQADRGLRAEMLLWRSLPGTLLLYSAAGAYFSLALWTLYSRREWKWPWIEILPLASGFSFPFEAMQSIKPLLIA
jgi:hypothetical protein